MMELRDFTFMPVNLYGLGPAKVKPLLRLRGRHGAKERAVPLMHPRFKAARVVAMLPCLAYWACAMEWLGKRGSVFCFDCVIKRHNSP